MTATQRAIIAWIPTEQGGRAEPPPGPQYMTMARFEEDDQFSLGAWTLVVKFIRSIGDGHHTLADVGFLNDDGPLQLLHPGSRFVLMEGARRVAKAVVLPPTAAVPDRMSEFETSLIGG
jgi:hypothetical protein